jgi:hypothetical protein
MSTPTKTSVAEVIDALSYPYPPINLNKHYKGVILNQPGRIMSIEPDSATVKVTEHWPPPSLKGKIYLRSEVFTGAIAATIRPVDFGSGIFHLSDLCYGDWCERQVERVQPKRPTYITLHVKRKSYRAFLEDISTKGMGILADNNIDPDGRLKVGEKLSLDFELESERLIFHLYGEIVHRQAIGSQLIKLGLHLFPSASQKTALQRYTSQRQHEILAEMEQDIFSINERYRVENLYF